MLGQIIIVTQMNSRNSQNKQRQQVLNKIPIFLAKTYRIVDNPDYQDIIGWNVQGDAFVVYNVSRLTTEVFPQHFKHNNFLSFVRQLNMYGFHKIISASQVQGQVFRHECFRRDNVQPLLQIKRKNAVQDGENTQIVAIPGREQKLEKQVLVLRSQHEQLQSMMEVLIQQNKTITAQNKAFAHMMGQMREKYRKKLQTLMLLFLFGKKNKPDSDFLFPPQFSNVIEAFEQMNHNGTSMYMLPQKNKRKRSHSRLPMITHGEHANFYSDGERSEISSQFDRDDKEDIFRVLNSSKSQGKREQEHKVEEEKVQRFSENEWKDGIPISPISMTSRPERIRNRRLWDDEYLSREQNSEYSQIDLEKP